MTPCDVHVHATANYIIPMPGGVCIAPWVPVWALFRLISFSLGNHPRPLYSNKCTHDVKSTQTVKPLQAKRSTGHSSAHQAVHVTIDMGD